ncbi:MAG TPA: septal ring lytic transglycosylase RlpA family lipoprotein [Treponema sp.]|nr:septal ring lytic transglycosylase RlpA family lipoprotein [Treponema sp.]
MMRASKLFCICVLCGIVSAVSAQNVYKTDVVASYYADKFNGRKTASGETFNMYGFTAAHKTLPFNTIVKVTNLDNGKTVNVRVNDRGPFVEDREIDLSKAAAQQLGMTASGTARVSLEIVQSPDEENAEIERTLIAASAKSEEDQRWDIQLGAFADKGNAKLLARRLMQAGFTNVAYQKVGNITRVVLRDIATGDVDAVEDKLDKNGFTQYIVRERKNIVTKTTED